MKRKFLISSFILLIFAVVLFADSPIWQNIMIDVYKGNTVDYRFTVRNNYDNAVVDLTGKIVKFRVKKNVTDSSFVLDKTCALDVDPTTGRATLTLTTSDTDKTARGYFSYVEVSNVAGTFFKTGLKSTWNIVQ